MIYAVVSIIIIFFTIYSFTSLADCDEWPLGLNNTYINNSISCKVRLPTNCQYKIFSAFQDFNKIRKINCKNKKDGKKDLLKKSKSPFINIQTLHIII